MAPAGAPPPALSLSLSITSRHRRSVCRGYTNKGNLERQQSITAALKVTAAPSAASASPSTGAASPFFPFPLFNLFLLRETKGRRLFPLSRVCVVPGRKERKKENRWWVAAATYSRSEASLFLDEMIVGGVCVFFFSAFPF